MNEISFKEKIEMITSALKKAGYNPYEQLHGYVSTGEVAYITRQDNARQLVVELDKEDLKRYLMCIKNDT